MEKRRVCHCPSLGQDKINFIYSNWQSAVFQVQHEKELDNTWIIWLLLNCVYPEGFLVSYLCP